MQSVILIINYSALVLIFGGLFSILKDNFKVRDITFLTGTSLLTISAFLTWLAIPTFGTLTFVFLFGLQVVANVFQLKLKKESLKTLLLFILSLILFLAFFLIGLLQNLPFFLFALGVVIASFGYRELPEHAVRQSTLFAIAAVFESLYAYLTVQYLFIYINIVFVFLTILIIRKGLAGKIKIPEQEVLV